MDLIIGAGITGLAYAAYTKNDFIVIEKENEPGGYCRTIKQDGFTWDYSGHFFHFQNEDIRKFIMSRIPSEHILRVEKNTHIKYKDLLVDYPFQKNIHQLEKAEFIDCLYDLFNNPYECESTFKEMLYKKFGRSIAEKFLIPYNEKLYACDLNSLDVNAMGRFFPYANKEDIIKNFKLRKEKSYNSTFLYPIGGAEEYVNALYNNISKSKIYLEESIVSIDVANQTAMTNKRSIRYDNLVSTTPFPNLLSYCDITYDKELYTCNKVLVFNIGFDKKGLNTIDNWIYFPEDKYIFYRVGCYDNIYGSDRLSVYVEIGYKENEQVDIEKTYERVLNDMKIAGLISNHKVVSACHILMDPAYVHITKEMEFDKAKKMEELAKHHIYSIGRYGSWIYCSIEDNIIEAKLLANKLCSQ